MSLPRCHDGRERCGCSGAAVASWGLFPAFPSLTEPHGVQMPTPPLQSPWASVPGLSTSMVLKIVSSLLNPFTLKALKVLSKWILWRLLWTLMLWFLTSASSEPATKGRCRLPLASHGFPANGGVFCGTLAWGTCGCGGASSFSTEGRGC